LRRNTQAASQILDQVDSLQSILQSVFWLKLWFCNRSMFYTTRFRSILWNLHFPSIVSAITCPQSLLPLLFVFLSGEFYFFKDRVLIKWTLFHFSILDENDTDGSKLWNHSMVYYSGYTYESLEPLMEKLCGLVASADVSKFQVT
jgi:hypothetical protein